MKHGSLFSGIGGFDLAAEWMGWENKFHCEWNPFGQKVLHYYWPNAEQFTDITKSDFTKYANRIDILTGGFPCQPYSSAGSDSAKKMRDISGLRCCEQLERLSHVGSWAKTFVALLIGMEGWYSKNCVLTWKILAIKSRHFLYLRAQQMPHIKEKEFGLLPTPTCQDAKQKENSPSQQHKVSELAIKVAGGSGFQLSPQFVIEMMGFPTDWTELPFQNGETSQSKQEETQ